MVGVAVVVVVGVDVGLVVAAVAVGGVFWLWLVLALVVNLLHALNKLAVGARTVFGPKWTAPPPLIHAPQGVVFSFLSCMQEKNCIESYKMQARMTCMRTHTHACMHVILLVK